MCVLSKIKSGFDINQLSSFRTALMGIATIMIIMCHAPASGVLMPKWLAYIFSLGNFGVDIFLLLSGLGLFYSLSHISRQNYRFELASFYKKRFIRIFVPYLLVYIPFCIVMFLLEKYSLYDCILCLSTFEFWLFHRGAWFVSLIIVLYLISPLLFKFLNSEHRWPYAFVIIVCIMLICNLSSIFRLNQVIWNNIIFALERVPCFILGMALGRDCQTHKHYSWTWFLVFFATFFLCDWLAIDNGVTWLLTPIIIVLALFFLHRISNLSATKNGFSWLGNVSLESYLSNITLNKLLVTLIPAYISSSIFYGRWLEYSIVIILGLVLAYFVNQVTAKILTII